MPESPAPDLTRVVRWAHQLLAEVVPVGGLVVDLTAGKGQDTLALFRMVGGSGQVIAFDVQPEALAATQSRLRQAGASTRQATAADLPLKAQPGVDLLCCSHDQLARTMPGAMQGIVANLGYLPGGNRQIITRPQSTLSALEQACSGLDRGGRVAIVVYPGHAGGADEAEAVKDFFAALDEQFFQVLELRVANRSQAPSLFVAEKLLFE
jgi:16S rRNA C1402 N4-methylase RsmH